MKYIPLNIKTEYDLMNSLIRVKDLISFASKKEIYALGITDTNMFGTMEFINECNKNNIKPIIGTEIKIDDLYMLLYAKNYNGLTNLFKIVSYKNIEEKLSIDYIKDNSSDLIIVTSAKYYEELSKYFDNIYIKYHNSKTKEIASKLTDNIVYMDMIRYFDEEDKEYFKYLKYIDEAKTIDEKINIYDSYFKLNISDSDTDTTIEFANLIDIELPETKLHIPVYNDNSLSYLKALAKKGLEKRLNNVVPDIYKNRLMYELSVIEKMNFVDYFLIVYDFVLYAKKHNIYVGPGRGSGAASLVNYSLGIINVDPLKYSLIFERFLNPDRITMPDIDIDFDNTKRDNVIEYVSDKYGHDKTARIISFNTMLPKQIIRDMGRVLKYDNIVIDNICKTINDEKDFISLKSNKSFVNLVSKNNNIRYLVNCCNKLCGLKKNTSMHAAGVVISDISLNNFMPLYKSNNIILTGYSMEYIESLGLLKMDFLSIKNLNTISNIVNDIKNDNYDIDLNNIPLNDPQTLKIFSSAYTTGIFQFESSGMKNFLKQLKVDNFNTLVDAIALYRPGPRDMIGEYILRKEGKKKVTYLVKELEPILKSTYGIIIYQEQVLEILRLIGGYTYAEADLIRRAMSKKKADIIEKSKSKFINGVIKHGYDEKIALELYDLIIKFSSYGFNKSHSVVYSLVAYQMAYLKSHYTKYFMRNLLNMNISSDKIKDYIEESKKMNIKFLKVDINKSTKEFITDKNNNENNNLRLPFNIIKNISGIVSDEIINERNKSEFKSFNDFMIRCYGKNINKRIIISLIVCGAFDSFNINKKATIGALDEIINYAVLCKDLNIVMDNPPMLQEIEDFNDIETIDNEINNYGFYLSKHPVTKYIREGYIKLNELSKYYNKIISLILFLEDTKMIKTKNNDNMCFLKFSDDYGTIEAVMFSDALLKITNLDKNKVYKVNAKVEKREESYQLIVYGMFQI